MRIGRQFLSAIEEPGLDFVDGYSVHGCEIAAYTSTGLDRSAKSERPQASLSLRTIGMQRLNVCRSTNLSANNRANTVEAYHRFAPDDQTMDLSLRHALWNDRLDDRRIKRFVIVQADGGVEFGAGLHPVYHLMRTTIADDRTI